MNRPGHRRRSRQLLEFAAGRLEPAESARVERHLGRCEACRSWLATYRLLEETAPGMSPSERHPAAEDLARFALERASLEAPVRDRIGRHLAACLACRQDVQQCRGAVLDAKRSGLGLVELAGEPARSRPAARVRRIRLAVAAAVATVGIGVGALFLATQQQRRPSRSVIAGQSFRDRTLIEAPQSIAVVASSIDRGAAVTLRAQEVALGEGFSVREGASLSIETPSRNRSERP